MKLTNLQPVRILKREYNFTHRLYILTGNDSAHDPQTPPKQLALTGTITGIRVIDHDINAAILYHPHYDLYYYINSQVPRSLITSTSVPANQWKVSAHKMLKEGKELRLHHPFEDSQDSYFYHRLIAIRQAIHIIAREYQISQ